jgi:hypothetical protein
MKFLLASLGVFFSSLNAFTAVDPLNTRDFEILGVKLNSDSYLAVVDKLGATKLVRPKSTGAGYEGPAHFCYRGKKGTRLTFLQNFSTDYSQVSGYRIETVKKTDPNCRKLDIIVPGLHSQNGLGLGMKRKSLEDILGTHAKRKRRYSSEYTFEKHIEGKPPAKGLTATLNIKAEFDAKSRVKALEVEFESEPD